MDIPVDWGEWSKVGTEAPGPGSDCGVGKKPWEQRQGRYGWQWTTVDNETFSRKQQEMTSHNKDCVPPSNLDCNGVALHHLILRTNFIIYYFSPVLNIYPFIECLGIVCILDTVPRPIKYMLGELRVWQLWSLWYCLNVQKVACPVHLFHESSSQCLRNSFWSEPHSGSVKNGTFLWVI